MTNIPIAAGELVDVPCLAELARAHWRKLTTKQVVSSTTTTDLLNGEFTIDANAMGAQRTLRLVAKVEALNNVSLLALPRFTLTLGGTTFLDTSAPAAGWAADATPGVWKIVAEITNLGAANAQDAMLDIWGAGSFAGVGSADDFVTGDGTYSAGLTGSTLARALGFNTGLAIDTTAAKNLTLTVKLPTNSASCWAKLYDAYVEII